MGLWKNTLSLNIDAFYLQSSIEQHEQSIRSWTSKRYQTLQRNSSRKQHELNHIHWRNLCTPGT